MPDYGLAVHWLTLAADQNNAQAQHLLGDCYENGWGVEIDAAQAETYHDLAVQNGYQSGE